ncbi:MAG: hypothetical protein IPJ49_26505 [Candidatus Obscuribacter sp.]|nr:hypothetical protein [Candidatus Obscuribacter sp.]
MDSEACEAKVTKTLILELLDKIEDPELRSKLRAAFEVTLDSYQSLEAEQKLENQSVNFEILTQLNREVRVPLNAIMVLSESLTRSPLDASSLHCANLIKDAGQSLNSLIEGTLEVAKIDLGGKTIAHDQIDLNILIEDVFQTLALENLSFGAPIKLDIQCPLPDVIGEAGKLRQILLHLTKQAMRFSSNRITLRVSEECCFADDQSNDKSCRLEATQNKSTVQLCFCISSATSQSGNPADSWSQLRITPAAENGGILRPQTNLGVYIAQRLLNSLHSELRFYELEGSFCYNFKMLFETADPFSQESESQSLSEEQGDIKTDAYDLTLASGIDEKALLKRFNRPVAKTVLKLFAQTATLELWKIENSLAKRCLTEVNEEAQSFIHSCRTVCAEDLVLVCADVERASRREDVEEVRRLVNQLKEKVQITLKEIKESYDK